MKQSPFLFLGLCVGLASCGGGGGGGGPTLRPNQAPILVPAPGLAGLAPRLSYELPFASAATLTFTASDGDGDPMQWQLSVPPQDAVATGLVFTTPRSGATFVLEITPVLATAATTLQLLVQDAFGGASAIDLVVARTGAPTLADVQPASSFAGQPQDLVLTGTGFALGGAVSPSVTVGGLPATGITVVDDHTLRCRTPSLATTEGPTVVRVQQRFGSASLPAAAFTLFRYPPRFQANDVRLDGGTAAALELANDGNRVHAVWVDSGRIDHRRSLDGGLTWGGAQPLSGGEIASAPQVFVRGNDVTVVWIGDDNAVWTRRSIDGGVGFQAARRLDAAAVPEVRSARPRLCGDGDHRYVAWLEGSPIAARVAVAASADAGTTWEPAQFVADTAANQDACEIACDGARAWVVFEDDRIGSALRGVVVDRTIDGGATWGADRRLNRTDSAGAAPRLCRDGAAVHVVWQREGGVYYNGSTDRGASWRLSEERVRGTDAGALSAAWVTAEAGRIHVGYVAAGTDVWIARSTDAATFPERLLLDSGGVPVGDVRIVGQGQYVCAAWRRGDVGAGSARVVHAESTDAGATFGTPAPFGDGAGGQDALRLLQIGARRLLGWLENRTGTVGAFVNATAP